MISDESPRRYQHRIAFTLAVLGMLAMPGFVSAAAVGPGDYLGIAEHIDNGDADLNDEALVLGQNHVTTTTVNTIAEWINEIAVTISHEYGHLLGLVHTQGTTATIMNGFYNGVDKAFNTTDEDAGGPLLSSLGELDALTGDKVIWLDFLGDSFVASDNNLPGLDEAGQWAELGVVGAAAIATQITNAITAVETDYAAVTGGATFSFVSSQPANGDFAIVAITAPEPTSIAMLFLGASMMARRRTIKAKKTFILA